MFLNSKLSKNAFSSGDIYFIMFDNKLAQFDKYYPVIIILDIARYT